MPESERGFGTRPGREQKHLVGMSSGSGKSTPTYRSVHYATLPAERGSSKPIINGRTSSNSTSTSYRMQYKVYRWRWLMLAALCALNVSNGMVSGSVRFRTLCSCRRSLS